MALAQASHAPLDLDPLPLERAEALLESVTRRLALGSLLGQGLQRRSKGLLATGDLSALIL
jgi:hypothetical protein